MYVLTYIRSHHFDIRCIRNKYDCLVNNTESNMCLLMISQIAKVKS